MPIWRWKSSACHRSACQPVQMRRRDGQQPRGFDPHDPAPARRLASTKQHCKKARARDAARVDGASRSAASRGTRPCHGARRRPFPSCLPTGTRWYCFSSSPPRPVAHATFMCLSRCGLGTAQRGATAIAAWPPFSMRNAATGGVSQLRRWKRSNSAASAGRTSGSGGGSACAGGVEATTSACFEGGEERADQAPGVR